MKLLCVLLITACVGLSAPASLRPTGLKCEYRSNPQGIDEPRPRLTWLLTATSAAARGLNQTAYQVVVASTAQKALAGNGDLWDSGKVDSGESVLVAYKGKSLASGMQAFWRVRIWDEQGRPSEWSETAQWSMGLLRPEGLLCLPWGCFVGWPARCRATTGGFSRTTISRAMRGHA